MDIMEMRASWRMVGIVIEKRELTTEKNKKWKGWTCKVETFGGTYSISLTEEQYKTFAEGELLTFVGRFEDRSGVLYLNAATIDPAEVGGKKP